MKTGYFTKSLIKNVLLWLFACWFIYELLAPWSSWGGYAALWDYRINPVKVTVDAPDKTLTEEQTELADRWFKSCRIKYCQTSLIVGHYDDILVYQSKRYSIRVFCIGNSYPDNVLISVKRISDGETVGAYAVRHDNELFQEMWTEIFGGKEEL